MADAVSIATPPDQLLLLSLMLWVGNLDVATKAAGRIVPLRDMFLHCVSGSLKV